MASSLSLKTKKNLALTIVGASLLSSGPVFAQVAQQTGVADPGRAGERISEQKLIPQAGPKIKIKNIALQNAPAGAEKIKFNFGGLEISGSSQYDEKEIYSLYDNKIGTKISLLELYDIANRITLKYRNDGYILTQVIVPPQTIETGIAKLQIIEGYIENVTLQGNTQSPSELDLINTYASKIKENGALNIATMERQLLLINDLPGVEARTIISPSTTASGAADMLIIVDRKDINSTVNVNNHGSRFLGPFQFTAATSINSLLGYNEQINIQALAAPDEGLELAYGSIEYKQPVGRFGTFLSTTINITETDPGYTLKQFDVEGLSKTVSLKAEHPIIRSRDINLFGRASFDWRNVESKNNIQPKIKDRIRSLRAGLRADFLDRLLGVAVNTVDLEISQGIDVLNATDNGDANITRALGDPTFTKANIQLQRLQRITNRINLLLSGRGQLSNNPLLSSEEFGLGGISTVRGYEPSETVGDDGIAGNVEVQWNNSDRKVQIYGFLDSGTVWNQGANNSAAKRSSLTSTGIGVRLDLPTNIQAEFVAAQPLHRNLSSQGERDPQFFFSLSKEF